MKRDDLEKYFLKLRFDPAHHLGLGDIRLTLGQQDELLEMCEADSREPQVEQPK